MMAATRRHQSLQIFQDPLPPQDHHDVAAYNPQYLDTFSPVTDVSTDHHTLLAPPQASAHEQSPRKTRHVSSSPPPKALAEKDLNAVSLPPPREPQFKTDAPMKKTPRPFAAQAHVMAPNPHFFANFPGHQIDKENVYPYPESALPKLAAADSSAKPPAKRSVGEALQPRDRSKKPKIKETPRVIEEDGPLPGPEEMPPVDDDGLKPPYSYAQLIGMAILRAPKRQLTLAQIYKWISETFAFYRKSQDSGWQNSIRHNLSLSKSFNKMGRPKDDPGKGHYWIINEGFEKQYYKVRTARRPTNPDTFTSAYSADLARPTTAASASFPPLSSSKGFDSSKFPEETELSSDATIPCSDPAAHDGHDPATMLPPRRIPSSPPPADIRSSPPPPVSRSLRDDTPPRAPRFPPSSRSGGRKRKFGDSGYYSSIESSAIKLGPVQTSEADLDRPSIKRGRAEEEIARIRGSSYDSPTKLRPSLKQPNGHSLISSPSRPSSKVVDPLTPAIVFKRPALPPASASPNTNLRNHRNKMRELVGGSPDKSLATWVDTSFLDFKSWSPAVNVPNEEHVNLNGNGFESTFDIFGDYDYNESPLKKSAKRPRLERAATSTGILADITGNKSNMGSVVNSPTPNWKFSSAFLNIPNLSPIRASPLKAPMLRPPPTSTPLPDFNFPTLDQENVHTGLSPFKSLTGMPESAQEEEDFSHLLHSDESEPGIDLLQGFAKIGARASLSAVAPNGSPQKKSMGRPSLARSSTTRF
jgi:hypothetical protein